MTNRRTWSKFVKQWKRRRARCVPVNERPAADAAPVARGPESESRTSAVPPRGVPEENGRGNGLFVGSYL